MGPGTALALVRGEMNRPARHATQLAALIAFGFAALAPAQAAPLSASERAQIFAHGREQLDARKATLKEQLAVPRSQPGQVKLTRFKGKGAGATRLSFDGSEGRQRLVLRVPGRGTGWGARANDAFSMLAAQLGHPEWVPASVVAEPNAFAGVEGVPTDTGKKSQSDVGKVMVVEYIKDGFKDGEDAPVEWLKNVPEQSRLRAAVIDLLGLSRDRKLANVMVNEQGDMRLIDHDVTFGMKSEKAPHYASSFWKGEALAYQSDQRSFDDLPTDVRRLVQAIAEEQDLDALKKVYPLSRSERLPKLQAMARSIMERGLDGAVAHVVANSTRKGFTRIDDVANATALRGH
jgi:hypothetical protein